MELMERRANHGWATSASADSTYWKNWKTELLALVARLDSDEMCTFLMEHFKAVCCKALSDERKKTGKLEESRGSPRV